MIIDGIDYHIAETRADLEQAFRLVYHNYVEMGYCHFNIHQMHFYLFDILPETRTLVAVEGGQVVGTVTLVFDTPLGLPSDHLYQKEINELRAAGRKLVELSKLSTNRQLGSRSLLVLRNLFRLAKLTANPLRKMTDFCALVEPHHEAFYQKYYAFQRTGDLRTDPAARGAPSLLLRLDLLRAEESYQELFESSNKPSNPYWLNYQDPLLPALLTELRTADEHLWKMHRRVESGQPLNSPTPDERSYVDFRLFALEFNAEKVSKEAQTCDSSGLFRAEYGLYEHLLLVLPPNYAPEKRLEIYRNVVLAAWYCGSFDRALALSHEMEKLAQTSEQRADSKYLQAHALHFLGRHELALQTLHAASALPELSPVMQAQLLWLTDAWR